ncbi:MAG: DUF134 domain-containing protein [Candidatus Odinarchaeota archaeon]
MQNEEDRQGMRRGHSWGGKGHGRRGHGRGKGGWRRGTGRPRVIPIIEDQNIPKGEATLELTDAEIKAIRLVDNENLTQEEAAIRMGVSRGTLWRYVNEARKKMIKALLEGNVITVRITEHQSVHDEPST